MKRKCTTWGRFRWPGGPAAGICPLGVQWQRGRCRRVLGARLKVGRRPAGLYAPPCPGQCGPAAAAVPRLLVAPALARVPPFGPGRQSGLPLSSGTAARCQHLPGSAAATGSLRPPWPPAAQSSFWGKHPEDQPRPSQPQTRTARARGSGTPQSWPAGLMTQAHWQLLMLSTGTTSTGSSEHGERAHWQLRFAHPPRGFRSRVAGNLKGTSKQLHLQRTMATGHLRRSVLPQNLLREMRHS